MEERIGYSTCSLEAEENEICINTFLNKYKSFKLKEMDLAIQMETSRSIFRDKMLFAVGPEIKGDGLFVAIIEKVV